MENTMEHSKTVNESEVSVMAYQMWEKAGHPPGRDLQFWLDAEVQVCAAAKAAPLAPAAHLSPVGSKKNTAHKAASVKVALGQPTSLKREKKVTRFDPRSPIARPIY
jgi:hypothetical protein